MKKVTVEISLTQAEWDQLASYIRQQKVDGWYYGNKEHFEKRAKAIDAEFAKAPLFYDFSTD